MYHILGVSVSDNIKVCK